MQSSCCLTIVTAVCILLHFIAHLYKIAALSYYLQSAQVMHAF